MIKSFWLIIAVVSVSAYSQDLPSTPTAADSLIGLSARKDKPLAYLLCIIPGGGLYYTEQYGKAAAYSIAEAFVAWWIIRSTNNEYYKDDLNLSIPLAAFLKIGEVLETGRALSQAGALSISPGVRNKGISISARIHF
jgi:hypothetical protein